MIQFEPFLRSIVALNVVGPSNDFGARVRFKASFGTLFFRHPTIGRTPFGTVLSRVFIILRLPTFSRFPRLLFLLDRDRTSKVLFHASPLKVPNIVTPRVLFQYAFGTVVRALARRSVHVELFTTIGTHFQVIGNGAPNIPFTDFLACGVLRRFGTLFQYRFAKWYGFGFPVNQAIHAFGLIDHLPRVKEVVPNPFQRISIYKVFRVLAITMFLFTLSMVNIIYDLPLTAGFGTRIVNYRNFDPLRRHAISQQEERACGYTSFWFCRLTQGVPPTPTSHGQCATQPRRATGGRRKTSQAYTSTASGN